MYKIGILWWPPFPQTQKKHPSYPLSPLELVKDCVLPPCGPGDELWFFYDPLAHELPLRIQSTELRTEPMVLDLGGLGTNRLRYLRDQRPDPLKMADLLPPAYDDDGSVSVTGCYYVLLWCFFFVLCYCFVTSLVRFNYTL